MVGVDGKFSQELREIKEGSVPPEVFEIPPGYQKMSTSQGLTPGAPPQGSPGD